VKTIIKQRWNKLSPDAKAPYETRHEEAVAKQRADEAKQMSEATSTQKSDDTASAASKSGSAQIKREPDVPRKARSAFALFSSRERKRVKSTDPELSQADVTDEVKQRWAAMSKKDRLPFEQRAEERKAKYDREVARLNKEKAATPQPRTPSADMSDDAADEDDAAAATDATSTTADDDGAPGRKRKRSDSKPPKRAQSAFAMFSIEARKTIKADDDEPPQADVTQLVKQQWAALGDDGQAPYEEKSQSAKERYEEYERELAREGPDADEASNRSTSPVKSPTSPAKSAKSSGSSPKKARKESSGSSTTPTKRKEGSNSGTPTKRKGGSSSGTPTKTKSASQGTKSAKSSGKGSKTSTTPKASTNGSASKAAPSSADKASGALKAPKKAQTAFAIYSNETRKAIKAENAALESTDVVKMVKDRWGKLSAAEKTRYEKKSTAAKERYDKALVEFDKGMSKQIKAEALAAESE
jgi:hypothetical protein